MSRYPSILHHGGHDGVTGSCHELRVSDAAGILVDCGLFQGAEEGEGGAGRPEIDFPVAHLKALVVTHTHLDHVGRIPHLLAAGFKGSILCSEPSARLLPLVLEDAVRLGITRDGRLIERFLALLQSRLVPVPYGEWHPVPAGPGVELAIKLQPAGHILGSAYVTARIRTTQANPSPVTRHASLVVFSGDLGAPYAPLLPAPKSPYGADLLVLESTYGDRLHSGRKERRALLQGVIERALADRGAVLVPAFAAGRTQELLYELEEILHRNRGRFAARGLPWEELEVILDSPLASRFTAAYRKLAPYWDAEARRRVRAGRRPLAFAGLTTIDEHAEHLATVDRLRRSGRPAVVIAASGMCAGGRIVNYLKALLPDARTDVVFVGYQARGTPGRAIQEYGPGGGWVAFDGERIPIRARIHTLSGYSAHADRQGLVNFVRGMRRKPAEIRLVHGEPEARRELAAALGDIPGVRVTEDGRRKTEDGELLADS